MPTSLLPNPTGAGYFNAVSDGGLTLDVEVDSSQATALPLGSLVEIKNYSGPGTSNPPTVPTIVASSTTADYKVLGVVVGGGTGRVTGALTVAAGQVAKVAVLGVAQVLMDATSTAGQQVIQSAATAGAAKCTGSATVSGQAIGTCLQAVTISTGTALVWCLLKPS